MAAATIASEPLLEEDFLEELLDFALELLDFLELDEDFTLLLDFAELEEDFALLLDLAELEEDFALDENSTLELDGGMTLELEATMLDEDSTSWTAGILRDRILRRKSPWWNHTL